MSEKRKKEEGILLSLRSPTVQNASQMIMLLLFMPLLLLQAVAFLLPSFIPVEPIKAALEKLEVGSRVSVIGNTIHEELNSKFKIIHNLSGHSLDQDEDK